MMKNQRQTSSPAAPETAPDATRENWEVLLERIAVLAHRRSQSLLDHDDDDSAAFDRGARCLRTLMSSAEVAHRLKRNETKEQNPDDEGAAGPGFTTADVEAEYRKIRETVERLGREDAGGECGDGASGDGNLPPVASGMGGVSLGGERP